MNQRIKDFLEEKVLLYNQPNFIELDPISIPHRFSKKQDIEIAGFFAAILAWDNGKPSSINAMTSLRAWTMLPMILWSIIVKVI